MSEVLSKRPELITPAQDWNTLKVLNNDVEAVYFGIENYNMRAKAKNFNRSDLKDIVEYCHNLNPQMKIYLCTNILIYDSELRDLENLISEAKEADIDAIIAHDLAAIEIAKRYNMTFHVSTQANISNIESARFYENLGAERIVLARELSLKQISDIKKDLRKTEIEVFVHGSMCTSISGRCYFSATITDNMEYSANRGNCVQPCRREWKVFDNDNNEFIYDGKFFLNTKDLCMIEHIPDLIEAQIDAFKIEGRMKDPIYIKTATECYREAIESFYQGTFNKTKVQNWIKRLKNVYNRGFHTGFFYRKPNVEDIELYKRGNISPYRKKYLGKILSFDKNSMSANVLIENKELFLRVGSNIIISGNESYNIETVKKIIFNGEKVKAVIRRKDDKLIKINLPLTKEYSSDDKIYIISKTYLEEFSQGVY